METRERLHLAASQRSPSSPSVRGEWFEQAPAPTINYRLSRRRENSANSSIQGLARGVGTALGSGRSKGEFTVSLAIAG